MKYCAKKAGEQSTELFLAVWVKNKGTIQTEAVVVDVKDRSFDAIICSTGTNIRVYTDVGTFFKNQGYCINLPLHSQYFFEIFRNWLHR